MGATATRPNGGAKQVVLCIDDSDLARQLIRRIVDLRDNTHLLAAATAREGLQLASKHRPSLILLDAGLPDSDAAAIVKTLRDDPKTAAAKIAVVSGWQPESVGLNDPTITHIMKPFQIDVLLDLLDGVFGPS